MNRSRKPSWKSDMITVSKGIVQSDRKHYASVKLEDQIGEKIMTEVICSELFVDYSAWRIIYWYYTILFGFLSGIGKAFSKSLPLCYK